MKVRLFAGLRAIVGQRSVEVEVEPGTTLGELVDRLVALHPGLGEELFDAEGALSRHVNVIVDGRMAVHLPDCLATRLSGDEEVHVFPAVAGG